MNKHSKDKLIEKFRDVESEIKQNLADEKSSLKLGLAVLTLAQTCFNIEYLSLREIIEALDRLGIAANSGSIGRAFSRAGNKIRRIKQDNITEYKVMIPGQREVDNLISTSGLEIIYVQGGKPRTTRKKFSEVLKTLKGVIRICDPYYGLKTLDALEMFSKNTHVKFLTARTNENRRKLTHIISDFKIEYPNVKLKKCINPSELHDRYIISKDTILIIGHGIKDIGSKESFIIKIDKDLADDLINTLIELFEQRWNSSVQI